MRILLRVALAIIFSAGMYTGGGIAIPSARAAQFCAYPAGSWQLCDEGRAFSECNAALSAARAEVARLGGGALVIDACPKSQYGNTPAYDCSYRGYAAGSRAPCPGQQSIAFGYKPENKCENRPDWNGPFPYLSGGIPKNGSVTCNDGCKQAWYSTGDGYFNGKYTSVPGACSNYDDQKCKADFGSGYYWNQAMSACEPEESKCKDGTKANSLGKCEPEPCPEGMTQNPDGTCKKKDSECPAGQVKSPDGRCLPGDGQCAAGEVRGPDGTCKKDNDGDGEPDEPGDGDKDTFSGGDDCNSPPSCSGSPILCGQARIQWRIECNTRKNRNIAGGTCSTMPICTGERCDALEYSGLLMQWRAACALEKLASAGNGGTGEGSGDLKAIRDALTGTGGAVNPGTIPGSDAWVTGTDPPIKPDTSGYGWGGTCPSIPAVNVMGTSMQFDPTPLCNWLSLGSYFVLGLAALASLRIVATRDS
ncbi:hypothetical protein RS982_04700 [Stenotrophomonas indicatrix]|uniref:hypothetical protein n=1 Tax=Stenotrophomonas indicatrix TaxID=2045451 RepID=UPI0028F0F8B8|nr:hypothetical protein [Stenotrophomonas indicatrix]MDT9580604.1 hypothetical protein [Stenotrophomonas indicatrix]